MDDMVEALWRVLHSQEGTVKFKNMKTGDRTEIEANVGRLFPFECDVPDAQGSARLHKVKFSMAEQVRAGWSATTCVAIVEVRERNQVQHLQVHTFHPAYTPLELNKLLDSARANDDRRE